MTPLGQQENLVNLQSSHSCDNDINVWCSTLHAYNDIPFIQYLPFHKLDPYQTISNHVRLSEPSLHTSFGCWGITHGKALPGRSSSIRIRITNSTGFIFCVVNIFASFLRLVLFKRSSALRFSQALASSSNRMYFQSRCQILNTFISLKLPP